MGGGDCKDTAILLGSIIYAMSSEYGPQFWHINSENSTDPQDIHHVIVSAETDECSALIETTSANNMSPYEEINKFSVDIEPVNSHY